METIFKRVRKLESPIQDFTDLSESVLRLVRLQKEAFLLEGKIETRAQIVRLIWGVLAAVSIVLAILLGVFWMSWSLYNQGVSALHLALGSFAIFASIGAFFLWNCLADDSHGEVSKNESIP
jgi:hypothetical protein